MFATALFAGFLNDQRWFRSAQRNIVFQSATPSDKGRRFL